MGRPLGTRLSDETKEAMSRAQKRRWAAIRELMRRAEADGTLPADLNPALHESDELESEAV